MKRLIAEWEKQSCVLLAFPHIQTDWYDHLNPQSLELSLTPFVRIAQAIAYHQPVYIVCDDKARISQMFCSTFNMIFIEIETNDTWIRDYGCLSIEENGVRKLLDFGFDGWGGKFEASLDNSVSIKLHQKGYFGTTPMESIDMILEGGSIESDGEGTILTTSECLCNPNRNGGLTKDEVEERLRDSLGAERLLWLDHGYLAGDDTDSHIDTLARLVGCDTIAYVKCDNREDEHYEALLAMEAQLKTFHTKEEKPYTLVPLPMCEALYSDEGKRLPATYANFLIANGVLVYPVYGTPQDKEAHEVFVSLFPKREIIPVNCLRLIEQGGSLHCSTMQVSY